MHEINSNKDFLKDTPLWNNASLEEALSLALQAKVEGNKISIDTRTIESGNIFIGLKGPVYNGSEFATQALEKGAVLCIVDAEHAKNSNPQIVGVEDTYQALVKLATYNRERLTPKIIGITGSYGKTTTKELLNVALGNLYETWVTPGNYNNQFGLPLSLANMPFATEIAVFEMGMNTPGEIEFLSKLARPDIAIITSVGDAHASNFSSLSGVAAAKSEIFAGMNENSIAIINIDNPYRNILSTAAADQNLRCITYGEAKDADAKIISQKEDKSTMRTEIALEINRKVFYFKLHSISPAIIQNSIPVIITLVKIEADIEYALQQIENFQGIAGRSNLLNIKNKIIIDDCYNASPAPMKAGIQTLGKLQGIKVAILGDMLELGPNEIQLHEELCAEIVENKIDTVITVGTLMKSLAKKLPNSIHYKHFASVESVDDANLHEIANLGDAFLFKASNGIGLTKTLKAFINIL